MPETTQKTYHYRFQCPMPVSGERRVSHKYTKDPKWTGDLRIVRIEVEAHKQDADHHPYDIQVWQGHDPLVLLFGHDGFPVAASKWTKGFGPDEAAIFSAKGPVPEVYLRPRGFGADSPGHLDVTLTVVVEGGIVGSGWDEDPFSLEG